MRPFVRLYPAALATLAVLVAACSDGVTAPRASLAPAVLSPSVAADARTVFGRSDGMEANFVLTPAGGSFTVAGNTLTIPANAVCDPATSTYGVTEWDAPCNVLRQPVVVHAVAHVAYGVGSRRGLTRVSFTPELRFVPTTGTEGYVWLTMAVPHDWPLGPLAISPILWVPDAGGAPVDEAVTDPTLRTVVLAHRVARRRIKHFSVYVISTGYGNTSLSVY